MDGSPTPRSALYETILAQPTIVRETLERERARVLDAATLLGQARRVILAGTGSSSHAAVIGEHLLRHAGLDAYATTNFDLATYPRALSRDDAVIVISHTGTTRFGRQALARARGAGARTIGVTGRDALLEGSDLSLGGAGPERSDTYTASYTAILSLLALLAVTTCERTGSDDDGLRTAVERLPDLIAATLACEQALLPLAEALAARGRIVFVGAGPNAATAREGALKIKESSYLVAEGFELETSLHGPLLAVQRDDIAVVIAAYGPAVERVTDLVRALATIGARLVLIVDERVRDALVLSASMAEPVAHPVTITFPAVPEVLSPILAVLPLQLLADLTARGLGTNPDIFRADDPRYKHAVEGYTL